MKKYLSGLVAALSAIAFSSFTAPRTEIVSFHFLSPNGYESAYEDAWRWTVASSSWECNGTPNDVCILRIPEDYIYSYSGTQTEQLAAYLTDQGIFSLDFSSASEAVAHFTYSMKP